MIGTELLFLLILFVVRSSSDCIQELEFADCSGHSFDSFTKINENCRRIRVINPPKAVFILDKSKNQYLHLITTLYLWWNENLVISEYGFKDFVSLSVLKLRHCSIEALKGTWFLANNNITNFDCSHNKLRALFKSDLENLENLRYADFSHNLLESIEPHTFSEMKELRELRLAGNKLKIIPTGRLPMLHIIEMYANLIDIVPANIFTEMPKLQDIDLQYNAIQKIEDGAFKDLKDLSRLLLNNNFIEEITELTFSGLSETSLKCLDLSSNKIRRIVPGTFKEMPVVEYLNFSNNLIYVLNEDTFEGLDAQTVELHLNKIEIIGNNTFKGFKSLHRLLIDNNMLRSLTADIFGINLPNLIEFSARNNSIQQLDSELFKFTINIEKLTISSNNIEFLPEDIFVPLRKLEKLKMQDNLIDELTEGHIESLKSLKYLSIEHNKLTFIPLNQDSFPNLKEMRIGGNPWQCACLDEVQKFLNEKKITFIKQFYFDGRCPVCVPTYFKHCEKNIDFARFARIPETYKMSYTEQCRIKYLSHLRLDKIVGMEEFLHLFPFY